MIEQIHEPNRTHCPPPPGLDPGGRELWKAAEAIIADGDPANGVSHHVAAILQRELRMVGRLNVLEQERRKVRETLA